MSYTVTEVICDHCLCLMYLPRPLKSHEISKQHRCLGCDTSLSAWKTIKELQERLDKLEGNNG